MDYRTENYRWDIRNNRDYIVGWDEIRTFKLTVKNTRELPIKVEIKRHFGTPYWDLTNTGEFGQYEKLDQDTAKYTLELTPGSSKQFEYTLTTYHGTRQNEVIR